jgi:O-acetyl-ADP-ribose deacetylase (regulator of RNase III)
MSRSLRMTGVIALVTFVLLGVVPSAAYAGAHGGGVAAAVTAQAGLVTQPGDQAVARQQSVDDESQWRPRLALGVLMGTAMVLLTVSLRRPPPRRRP